MTQNFIIVYPGNDAGRHKLKAYVDTYGRQCGAFHHALDQWQRCVIQGGATEVIVALRYQDGVLVSQAWNPGLSVGFEHLGYGGIESVIDHRIENMPQERNQLRWDLRDLMLRGPAAAREEPKAKAQRLPMNEIYSRPLPLP